MFQFLAFKESVILIQGIKTVAEHKLRTHFSDQNMQGIQSLKIVKIIKQMDYYKLSIITIAANLRKSGESDFQCYYIMVFKYLDF